VNCRKCGHDHTKVINSRDAQQGLETRRRRKCDACGYRWTTTEVPETQLHRTRIPKKESRHV